MQIMLITIFCHIDDFLKSFSWQDDPQCRLSLAEIMTIALTAARFFGGNLESARTFLSEHGYLLSISKSRLTRRLHAIPAFFWHFIVAYLAAKQDPHCQHFLIDSFPISVCHPVRATRRSLFQGKQFVGYNASKQAWFTGLKVHLLTTYRGQPKQFLITPASVHDLKALQKMDSTALPKGSTLFGDKAYISQSYEKQLLLTKDIWLVAERRSNSQRGQSLLYSRYGKKIRKRIETAFSQLTSWLPRQIHAVTNQGFLLKLMMLITAFAISCLQI